MQYTYRQSGNDFKWVLKGKKYLKNSFGWQPPDPLMAKVMNFYHFFNGPFPYIDSDHDEKQPFHQISQRKTCYLQNIFSPTVISDRTQPPSINQKILTWWIVQESNKFLFNLFWTPPSFPHIQSDRLQRKRWCRECFCRLILFWHRCVISASFPPFFRWCHATYDMVEIWD